MNVPLVFVGCFIIARSLSRADPLNSHNRAVSEPWKMFSFFKRQLLQDFPKGIFTCDLAAGKFKQVHPADLNVLARERGTRQCPFRDSEILTGPVPVVSIMHIRYPLKSFC